MTLQLETFQEASARIGKARDFLYRLAAAGEIRTVKLGPRSNRIVASSLDDYLNRLAKEQNEGK